MIRIEALPAEPKVQELEVSTRTGARLFIQQVQCLLKRGGGSAVFNAETSCELQSSRLVHHNQHDETNLMVRSRATADKYRCGVDVTRSEMNVLCCFIHDSIPRIQKCIDNGPETWMHIQTSTLHGTPDIP